MSEDFDRVYKHSGPTGSYEGDPFNGVPVDEDIVDSVASKYDLSSGILARVLRDIEKEPGVIGVSVLFTGFDPIPVAKDRAGHLYLATEMAAYWDVVADRINLTSIGRKAVAEAHERQVRECAEYTLPAEETGIVVSCPNFPYSAISDVHEVSCRTTLTNRQATIWVLNQRLLNKPAIVDVLGISETLVRSELAAVERETLRVKDAACILDNPRKNITRLERGPKSDDWVGLDWSPWLDLEDREELLDRLPANPGVYRVRHTGFSGLLYIGESGSEGGLRERVGHGLASGLGTDETPEGGNHDATKPLWRVGKSVAGSLEVSVASPAVAADKQHRRCLEATLVAVCRRETGHTPHVMLNRGPSSDSQEIPDDTASEQESVSGESLSVPTWNSWQTVTAADWMGYDWTAPQPLDNRDKVGDVNTCLIRVWEPQEDEIGWSKILTAIGTSETPTSRLYNLKSRYGADTLFSVAGLTGLSSDDITRSRQLEEARYDLVGAHYLATGEPPRDQY